MTNNHIRKVGDEEWQYPNHDVLERNCGLFDMETYIKRRRGTLWRYLEDHRADLLEGVRKLKTPSRNANKVLWWNQPHITKDEMRELKKFWYK